ncbi:sensor histidine kinase [Paenibacillus sp. GCM10027626]|uniref:sensor histidine kinase n=1 Tax=Paenibacillus sp. GCM10027626 TaxID=3273411 RepID=UPI00362F09C0
MLVRAFLKKFHQTSFHAKLVWTYILLIFIPVVCALSINSVQLYNQTKKDYEGILEQLNQRTNVTVDDFFTNLTRNSFFYLTESQLHSIISKTKPQSSKQATIDTNYMQSAMEQFVLLNGNISTITALAPNGSVYGSKHASVSDISDTVDKIGRDVLRSSSFVVHVPESLQPGSSNGKNQRISIVRFLSDLTVRDTAEAYVKIDVNFKAVEHMLGGINDSELKLGMLVFDGAHLIYSSDSRLNVQGREMMQNPFSRLQPQEHQFKQLRWNDQQFLVSGSLNQTTGWTIIQFIPMDQMLGAFIGNTINYVLFGLLALLAAFLLAFFFNRYFVNPLLQLSKAMKTIDAGHIHHAIPWSEREDEIGRLINSYNAMLERLQKSRESEQLSGTLQKKAEMKMLQAQINPHFLYNTLNAIHAIAQLNRITDIATMTKCLSSLYRFNIKYGDEVTIATELEQIHNYVQIQQIRFLHRFQVEYDISPEVLNCKILKFLIQPLVENSFYHGLEPKDGQGLLKLTIRRHGHTLFIRVEDNGIGIDPDKLQELNEMFAERSEQPAAMASDRNFGLRNVHYRIKHFYGEDYWMKIASKDSSGTIIDMYIPVTKEEPSDENRDRR